MRMRTIGLLALGCCGCGAGAPPPEADSPPVAESPAAPAAASIAIDPPVPAAAAVVTPPPEATIKAMLEKEMWGPPAQGGTQHTYVYRTLKIAPAREGNYLTDGVPANSKTMVHPVKVAVDITKLYTDGSTAQESKDQMYVFFQDEFGDWTYRFVQNN